MSAPAERVLQRVAYEELAALHGGRERDTITLAEARTVAWRIAARTGVTRYVQPNERYDFNFQGIVWLMRRRESVPRGAPVVRLPGTPRTC